MDDTRIPHRKVQNLWIEYPFFDEKWQELYI